MRGLCIVVLTCVAAVALGSVVRTEQKFVKADKEFLLRQKAIFEVLHVVQQKTFYKEHLKIATDYSIEANLEHYTNTKAIKEFLTYWKEGMLPQGEIFTIMNDKQREEAIALFHVFYYAKDWETFYKTMVWARDNVNEGMFVYALTVATLHRKDLQGIVLPAPYEIYPYYFVNSDVIQKAYKIKMQGVEGQKDVKDKTVLLRSKHTGWYVQMNHEQKLSYFTEDIGLNSYYYYFHMDYPFWMGGEEFGLNKDYRGELYMFNYQQLLARYYMERLSNGLGEIPVFSWAWPVKTGYYPSLRYANGLDFPVRHNFYNMHTEENIEYLQEVEDFERRIRDVISKGYFMTEDNKLVELRTPEGIDTLGKLVQSNPDSPNTRYYRYMLLVAKYLLGSPYQETDDYKVIPSVLEHFETAMRDPVFWQLYKRIVRFYFQYKEQLPSYTYDELAFPGVKIQNVEVDKLITYFEGYKYDITNGMFYTEEELLNHDKFYTFKVEEQRLTHKPFSYKMEVVSDKEVDSVIRVFIGPKYDSYDREINIKENRENFFEIDQFFYKITNGKTIVERNSADFYMTIKDRTPSWELYQKVLSALDGKEEFHLDQTETHSGFPERLLLPKGKRGGMPFQFYFIVSPYLAPKVPQFEGYNEIISSGVGSGARYMDSYALGYPFDREIDETTFFTPNMYFKDVVIFHKYENELNVVV